MSMAAIQIEQLRSSVRGAIVGPDDEAYEAARMVYNRMIDKRPALIVRCVDVADVIAAVDYARTNNVLTADVVLADGSIVTADEETNPDLFWALRGGGGNFGVVTSFEFRAHPVRTVYAGPTFWPLDETVEVMKAYREFIVGAPEYVNGFFAFPTIPPAPMFPEPVHLKKVCGVMWVCTGPAGRAESATRPMRAVGKPVLDQQG